MIDKAMAGESADRYPSAGELGRELDAFLARRPTSLDRSRLLRAALWCRRNPQLSLTAAAAAVLAILTFAAYFAVVDLRGRARALDARVKAQEVENTQLSARMAKARADSASTEADLRGQNQALATLRRALGEERKLYENLRRARDKAVHDADAATRQLVDELTVARSDRDAAELGREMYESFWSAARSDAETAAKERDQAQHDRDAARAERDQLEHERDAAREERNRLQAQREHDAAEIERLTAAAAAAAARIDELKARLPAAPPRVDAETGSAAPRDAMSEDAP